MAKREYNVEIFGAHEGQPSQAVMTVISHSPQYAAKTMIADHWGADVVFVSSKTKGMIGFVVGEQGELAKMENSVEELEVRRQQQWELWTRKRTAAPVTVTLGEGQAVEEADATLTEWAIGATFELTYQVGDDEVVVREYRWRSRGMTRFGAANRAVGRKGGWAKLTMVWYDQGDNERRAVVVDKAGNRCEMAA